jgi:hypothetical protein
MSILRSALVAAIMAASFVTATARADDLAGTVAAKLRESGTLSGYRLNVKAKSGTVWLEGRVADQKQLEAAVSVAENTPGVERVVEEGGAFVLEAGGEVDLVARAGEAVAHAGWTLRELRQQALDLEDVFLELVRAGRGR